MGQNSKIEWCDHTFNPWRGCTKVSAGCANCYAEATSKRNPRTLGIWGDQGTRVVASEGTWKEPLIWNRKAQEGQCPGCNGGKKRETHESGYGYAVCDTCNGTGNIGQYRARVFCASLADVFEDWQGFITTSQNVYLDRETWRASTGPYRRATLDNVRRRLFTLIDSTPNLDWLLLTKRPENIRRMWPEACPDLGDGARLHRPNVWLGTSVENQEAADTRIPELLKCRDLAQVLFLSCEPLLGPVDLKAHLPTRSTIGYVHPEYARQTGAKVGDVCVIDPIGGSVDWVIVGGESGANARPCVVEWVYDIVLQCRRAGIPCFVKQLGAVVETCNANLFDWRDDQITGELPTVANGFASAVLDLRHPKGGDSSEWPDELRVQEFPHVS